MDPRIDVSIEHVDDEIHQDEQNRDYQDGALDHRKITR
jgi:hypothetical protein